MHIYAKIKSMFKTLLKSNSTECKYMHLYTFFRCVPLRQKASQDSKRNKELWQCWDAHGHSQWTLSWWGGALMLVDKALAHGQCSCSSQMRWLGWRLCAHVFLAMLDDLFIYAAVCRDIVVFKWEHFFPHTGATKRKALSYLKKIAVSVCAAV